jgi:hypothetical protein
MKKKALALWLTVSCSAVFALPADEIRGQLEKNNPKEAYAIGKANVESLGDPLFDFWFGIAAMDAGSPGEGVLALERYALQFPDNRSGRFHLARGYYILGEDSRARDEFEALRPSASGEELAAIERYLDAIRARESRYQPTANAWLEAGFGYDSNINSGIKSGSSISIPGLGMVGTSDSKSVGTKESDFNATFSAGVQGTRPLSPGVALFGAAALDGRGHFSDDNRMFNQYTYAGNGGLSLLDGKNLYRMGLAFAQQVVDNQNYQATYGAFGEWSRQFDQFNRLSLGVSFGKHDYDNIRVYPLKDRDSQRFDSQANLRNDNYWGVSSNWTHAFGIAWQPILGLSAAYQREDNQEHRGDFSRDVYNLRGQLSFTPAPRWGVAVGLGYFEAKHDDNFSQIVGGDKRHDRNLSTDMTLSYRYNKSISTRLEASWSDQRSNIDLFDYSRWTIATKLRYEFN